MVSGRLPVRRIPHKLYYLPSCLPFSIHVAPGDYKRMDPFDWLHGRSMPYTRSDYSCGPWWIPRTISRSCLADINTHFSAHPWPGTELLLPLVLLHEQGELPLPTKTRLHRHTNHGRR